MDKYSVLKSPQFPFDAKVLSPEEIKDLLMESLGSRYRRERKPIYTNQQPRLSNVMRQFGSDVHRQFFCLQKKLNKSKEITTIVCFLLM